MSSIAKNVFVPAVNVDVARELMLHHLGLASSYMAVLPHDKDELGIIVAEIVRTYPSNDAIATASHMFCSSYIGSMITSKRSNSVDSTTIPITQHVPSKNRGRPPGPVKDLYEGTRDLTRKETDKLLSQGLKLHTCNQQVATNLLNVPVKRIGRRLVVQLNKD